MTCSELIDNTVAVQILGRGFCSGQKLVIGLRNCNARFFEKLLVVGHHETEIVGHDANGFTVPFAFLLAGPARHVDTVLLQPRIERLQPTAIGKHLEFERRQMHDLRRLVGCKKRRHRVGIGTALRLGELDLHARMLFLEGGNGGTPPFARAGIIGLPGNELQHGIGHGRGNGPHRYQNGGRGAERQLFHSFCHGFLLQKTKSDAFNQTECRLRRSYPKSRSRRQVISAFAAIHVALQQAAVGFEDRVLEFVPLQHRQCR